MPKPKIKGEIWNLKICDSIMDHVHNFTRTIKELYIPKYEICFNCPDDDSWHCFMSDSSRYKENAEKLQETIIPDNIVNAMMEYLKEKEKMNNVRKWFEEEIEND